MLLLIQKYKYARIKNAQMQHILKILKAFSPWRLKKKKVTFLRQCFIGIAPFYRKRKHFQVLLEVRLEESTRKA